MGEFELIERFFKAQSVKRDDILLGIGDDAAIVQIPEGMQLAVTTDTLVSGTHFLPSAPASHIAYKALASNISDLAAMGAEPAWCSLALTLPKQDPLWLNDFCQSFFDLANKHHIALIGGDTTKGPLAITISLQGFVPAQKALYRKGAKIDDWIFVSGELGDSAAGLDLILQQKAPELLNENEKHMIKRHFYKSPQVELGKALRNIASSCLDISDGLCADLQHILKANQVGAWINADNLPISDQLTRYTSNAMDAARIALTSGEEYELCFTVPNEKLPLLHQLSLSTPVKLTCIGKTIQEQRLKITWQEREVDWSQQGWDHFI